MCWAFKINAFDMVAVKSPYSGENSSRKQSMG